MRIEVENVIIDWIDNRRGELGGGIMSNRTGLSECDEY